MTDDLFQTMFEEPEGFRPKQREDYKEIVKLGDFECNFNNLTKSKN